MSDETLKYFDSTVNKMCFWHGCPQQQQSQNLAKSQSPTFDSAPSQGHVMSVKCEQPLDELTVQIWLLYDPQTLNIANYIEAGWNYR